MANEKETVKNILAEMRKNMNPNGTAECQYLESDICTLADRIEAAYMREREAEENETLVKCCNTCNHFQRKRKWCRVHDYSPCDPSKLPLIWPNGPCPQWECKYNSRGGVEK